jgi:glycosyltransferase involved in cell wall biosynthesis
VSVVVPSYNNGPYIRQTLESILAQTLGDFELIVADHSSTDDTMDVIGQFRDPRMTVLSTPAGGGAQANWNRVSQQASAPYLKLVCGDDVLVPNALELQVAALDAHPEAVMVASQRRIVDARGDQVMTRRGLAGMTGSQPGPVAVRRSVTTGSNVFGEPLCVLLRRDVLAQVGWWDATFPYLLDQTTYARVLGHGNLIALPQVVGDFRLSNTQWSVDLAASQARQARGFHKWASEKYPQAISGLDVRIGDARATAMAFSRRTLYWFLAHRMHPK